MSEDDGIVARRGRRLPNSLAPGPEHALEDDDLLAQCLLGLPPRPSSLPRASLVCKRWRSLVSAPHFLRGFSAHHRKAPLLGFFHQAHIRANIEFAPALDPPDCIPAARFTLEVPDFCIRDCRHGRVLALNWCRSRFVVWNPLTGDLDRVAVTRALDHCPRIQINGAVVCAAGDKGHVHGGCYSSPFQVVIVGTNREGVSVCIYSSETCTWGSPISQLWPSTIRKEHRIPFLDSSCPSALVGNRIFWLLLGVRAAILELDLDRQSLVIEDLPPDVYYPEAHWHDQRQFLITHADGGGIGFVVLLGFSIQLWKRETNSDGFAEWVLANTIELSNLLMLGSGIVMGLPKIVGFAEDDNAMFLRTDDGVFMVHLETLQFKKLSVRMDRHYNYPFTSFYPTGS